eukprot:15453481-Alexandrium_andersonii.AAC.1
MPLSEPVSPPARPAAPRRSVASQPRRPACPSQRIAEPPPPPSMLCSSVRVGGQRRTRWRRARPREAPSREALL